MQQPVFQVGQWQLTPAINQISRPGRQVTLEPRLIDLLVYFAQYPDVVLSRDELIDNVWKRNIVTNHVVTQSISELRKCLKDGDENSPEYIVTVPKRGYKLAVPVSLIDDGLPDEESSDPVAAVTTDQGVGNPVSSEGSQPAEFNTQPPSQLSDTGHHAGVRIHGSKSRLRRSRIIVWILFVASLVVTVAFLGIGIFSARLPPPTTHLMLNPRDIDIRFQGRATCSNSTIPSSYMLGVTDLIANLLNTYSTFMVHNQTNFNYSGPLSSGKSLTIEFVNQRHYRAQQCFMAVRLVDNADNSTMLDKRYFITNDNQLSVQQDMLRSLSESLKQPWPEQMQEELKMMVPTQDAALQKFYQAHSLLLIGDIDSLAKASNLLEETIKTWPEFTYARAEKVLVDVLRHSDLSPDNTELKKLNQDIAELDNIPNIKNKAVYYQIQTILLLSQGHVDEADIAITKSIDLEMSWLNYVLLGKVYEMQGQNRLAADAYITAFNLRPGDNTLHWISNSIFQTSLTQVVPYLDKFTKND
ncbi:transcriptional regulator CadC [Salmonella enterica subsp. enterica serovar Choleraesuis]|nr:transcriptional regulator CadC [Salmonella enterica subsp. enterica serovar Choleraesuis]